jgi:hypothetical protein
MIEIVIGIILISLGIIMYFVLGKYLLRMVSITFIEFFVSAWIFIGLICALGYIIVRDIL